jgi:hypothetical protein
VRQGVSTGGKVSNQHLHLLTFVACASEVGTCKSFLPDVMGSDFPPLLASVKGLSRLYIRQRFLVHLSSNLSLKWGIFRQAMKRIADLQRANRA